MQSLFEKYRPASFDGVVGQDRAVKALRGLQSRGGFGGRNYFFRGPSGTGKTTLARIIANDLAEPWAIEEIDAADCTMEWVRDMEKGFGSRSLGAKTGKCWIVNEVHCIRGAVYSRLLTALESVTSHCAVCLTTTNDGADSLFAEMDDAAPFMSRCMLVPMASHGLSQKFAERVLEIARAEGLDGQPVEKYVRLAKDQRNNFRAMLCAVEMGAMQS